MFWLAIALLLVSAIWLALSAAKLRERLAAREAQLHDISGRAQASEEQLAALRNENGRLREDRRASEEKLATLRSAREDLANAFHAVSADVLRNNSQQFLALAEAKLGQFQVSAAGDLDRRRTAIDELVRPLKESLGKVDEKIFALAESQKSLDRETRRLVTALQTPSARGRWGEIQLRRVVELAGMLEYCDFTEQETIGTEDGRLRPDLIVRLPNGKRIVVDSKVSLKAYLEAAAETDENARKEKLREHAGQIRKHLTKLREKAYWAQFQPSPEFAVAFLPGEIFFSAALQHDPELIEFGVLNNIILATPTTLIALLKAVSFGWRQEQLTRNAEEIRKLGAEMFDRISVFARYFSDVGKNLSEAAMSYEKGRRSLESRLLSSARKFQELGAVKGAGLPEVHDGVPALLVQMPGDGQTLPAPAQPWDQ